MITSGGVVGVDEVIDILELLLNVRLHLVVYLRVYLVSALVDTLYRIVTAVQVELFHDVVSGFIVDSVKGPGVGLLFLCKLFSGVLRMFLQVLLGVGIDYRSIQVLLIFVVGYGAVVVELVQNVFLTLSVVGTSVNYQRLPWVIVLMVPLEGTVFLRALRYSRKDCRFRSSELVNGLSEVVYGCELDSVGSTSEADVVKVLLQYLVLE